MPNDFVASRALPAQSLTRLAAGVEGTYVFPEDAGGAVTPSSGLTLNVAAITANRVTINGVLESTAYAGGTVTLDAADINPRRDIIYYDQTGAVGKHTGTAVAVTATTGPSTPSLEDDEIAVAEVYVAGSAVTIAAGDIVDRRQGNATVVRKSSADTTKNSNTDLTNITGMNAGVAAASQYRVECDLYVTSGASGGIKVAFTGPSGFTVEGVVMFFTASGVAVAYDSDLTSASGSTAAVIHVRVVATVTISTTAGTLQAQMSQNVFDATDTTVLDNSTMVVRRVA